MRAIVLAVLVLVLLGAASSRAQDVATAGDALGAALEGRYPAREIVPQSCAMTADVVVDDGRLCLRDAATGGVRAVRRIGIFESADAGRVGAARHGDTVVFGVPEVGTVLTPFSGRYWRWDLASDAFAPLGGLEGDSLVLGTSSGILHRDTAGWSITDGGRARRVRAADDVRSALEQYGASTATVDGTTFLVTSGSGSVSVEVLTLEGNRLRTRAHVTLPGARVLADAHHVIASARARGASALSILAWPATEAVAASWPYAITSVERRDEHTVRLRGRGRHEADLDLRTGAITEPVEADAESALVGARSLHLVIATGDGVWLRGSGSRGALLDASGVASRRRDPAPGTGCACRGRDLACRRLDLEVAGACAGARRIATLIEYGDPVEPTLFTGDGRFRVDRLEIDYVRITRLSDGARLWARLLGDGVVLAQLADGTYFLGSRELERGLRLRDGPSLADAPLVPLPPELHRDTLVQDFFAPPPR